MSDFLTAVTFPSRHYEPPTDPPEEHRCSLPSARDGNSVHILHLSQSVDSCVGRKKKNFSNSKCTWNHFIQEKIKKSESAGFKMYFKHFKVNQKKKHFGFLGALMEQYPFCRNEKAVTE